jgi:hypothetical protein
MEMLRRAVIRAAKFGVGRAMPRPRINRQPDDACEGRLKRMNPWGNLAAGLQSVAYRTDRPEIPFFEKIAITKTIKYQWLTY